MAVPGTITAMGAAAHAFAVINRQVANPRPAPPGGALPAGRVNMNFVLHGYLEIVMQAKHDALFQGYCRQLGLDPRRTDGQQIVHGRNATAQGVLAAFYVQRNATACAAAFDQMQTRWRAQAAGGGPLFVVGTRYDAGIQHQTLADGYQYEISYWYDKPDVYVLFHCYPPRR